MTIQIPTAEQLRAIAKRGYQEYRKTVLEGPLCKKVFQRIDEAAQIGGTSWEYRIDSDEEYQALKVIKVELEEVGKLECTFCFNLLQKRPQYFVVKWGE